MVCKRFSWATGELRSVVALTVLTPVRGRLTFIRPEDAAPARRSREGTTEFNARRRRAEETVSRLVSEIAKGGGTLFANIDLSAAAAGAGLTLRPTTLLVFGNPKGGTPLMDQ
jgi:hypothetical protein